MTFSTRRRVEFRDTDAAGIVHFSAFFPMMEAAEHEMLRSLGIPIMPDPNPDHDSGAAGGEANASVTWPRVAAHCDYVSAARFEDELEINVDVKKIGASSIQYGFAFTRDGVPVANGTMTAVCCRLVKDNPAGETHLEKAPIPDSVRSRLSKHASGTTA